MARVCQVTGKKPMSGNTVSHANNKSRRRFMPNLHYRRFFVESEKGRQQLALKRTVGESILATGYCVHPKLVDPDLHPEQGPVWRWIHDNDQGVFERFSENYQREGVGAVRRIDDETLGELHRIFEVSGGQAFFDNIEAYSERKAQEMGLEHADENYMKMVYTTNSGNHQ